MARRRKRKAASCLRGTRGLGTVVFSERQLVDHAKSCGSHMFDRETMRFFGSRLLSVHPARSQGVTYFVTSERFVPSTGPSAAHPRKYTVRIARGCEFDTVGAFQAYRTAEAARKAARKLAGEGK